MLRNPVELVYSMHAQALYNFNEDEPDFRKAWELQELRSRGERIPPGCRAEQLLQYRSLGSLGEQLERLYTVFPVNQVMVIYFEDFIRDTRSVYVDVLRFLGLQPHERESFEPVNVSKTHKSKLLGWLTQTPPRPVISAVRFMRTHLGLDIHRPLQWVRHLNERPVSRPPMEPALRCELQRVFADDIRLLERLTDRNLQAWLD